MGVIVDCIRGDKKKRVFCCCFMWPRLTQLTEAIRGADYGGGRVSHLTLTVIMITSDWTERLCGFGQL